MSAAYVFDPFRGEWFKMPDGGEPAWVVPDLREALAPSLSEFTPLTAEPVPVKTATLPRRVIRLDMPCGGRVEYVLYCQDGACDEALLALRYLTMLADVLATTGWYETREMVARRMRDPGKWERRWGR